MFGYNFSVIFIAGTKNKAMIEVHLKENESIERALKRLRKKLDNVRVLREFRARRYYTKPTAKRRDEKLKAIYKQRLRTRAYQ